MHEINNSSILITGGGSGIGAGTAEYFCKRGAKVTICGRRKNKIDAVARKLGPNCIPVTADVTKEDDRRELISRAVEHGGGLDALVNNAGNMYRGPLETLEQDKVADIFSNNVIGAMMLTGLATEHLAQSRGSVVFIGSVHNRRAFPGVSPYAATKGAVEALTRSLAAELGDRGIRVNCVAPGAVFTEINQRAGLASDAEARARLDSMANLHVLGRIGSTDEVAEAIAYLVCAQWTTGTIIDIDGGLGLGITRE